MHFALSPNCVQVQTLPIAQDTPVLTDSFSRCYDPYTHACKARPLSSDGWTSLSVIVIVIRVCTKFSAHCGTPESGPVASVHPVWWLLATRLATRKTSVSMVRISDSVAKWTTSTGGGDLAVSHEQQIRHPCTGVGGGRRVLNTDRHSHEEETTKDTLAADETHWLSSGFAPVALIAWVSASWST